MKFPASPGPWKFGYTDDLQTPIIVDANDDVVCVMHEGVTIRDGKLMAVAPELLEALIAAEKKLVELEHMVGGGDDEVYVEGAILNARAAIAKATGK